MTALMAAPSQSCRQVMSFAVASRKASQNSPKFSTSDTAMASTDEPAPGRTRPAPAASPDRTVVAMKPVPTTTIKVILRSHDHGNPGRREKGISHAELRAWEIPFSRRPGFPWSWLRSITLIVVVGTGFIATTVLSGLAAGAGRVLPGAGSSVLAIAVSLVLNFGLFWLAFRLATAKDITWRQLWLGAAISAVIWQILQAFGGYFLSHQIAHASPLYGTFAVVLGLIAWLYLQAELTLYAVEINVVRAYRLWPRSLAPPPYTEQDRHAFRLYVEKRGDQLDIAGAGGEDDREKTSG